MKLTVLTENMAGGKFLSEHGLSYLIEHDNKTVLFDTGHSDVFLKNASAMGIDLKSQADIIVLSHGHWDHGDGLRFIKDKTLITHPSSFIKRYRKRNNTPLGLTMSRQEIENNFDLITSDAPYAITDDIIYMGHIPRLNDFEAQSTAFTDSLGQDDFVEDDSALAVIQNNELIIVSGCAHAGICNTIEHAKKVTGINKIKAVIGGFHLKKNNLQSQKTVQYFKQQNIPTLLPSHCTELPALALFHDQFNTEQVRTGMVFNF